MSHFSSPLMRSARNFHQIRIHNVGGQKQIACSCGEIMGIQAWDGDAWEMFIGHALKMQEAGHRVEIPNG